MHEPLRVPIACAGTHVRLAPPHVEALFGREVQALGPLGPEGSQLRLTVESVEVHVGDSVVKARAVLAPTSEFWLGTPLPESWANVGVKLVGPEGSLILATPIRNERRLLVLSDDDFASLSGATKANVTVHADRSRVFAELAVERGPASVLWLQSDDLNALDLRPENDAVVEP